MRRAVDSRRRCGASRRYGRFGAVWRCLALFGALVLGVCIAACGAMAQRAGVAPGHRLSACAGAICSVALYASLALALALALAVLAASPGAAFLASVVCAASVTMLLPPMLQAAARQRQ
jgi:hypothetical protein